MHPAGAKRRPQAGGGGHGEDHDRDHAVGERIERPDLEEERAEGSRRSERQTKTDDQADDGRSQPLP